MSKSKSQPTRKGSGKVHPTTSFENLWKIVIFHMKIMIFKVSEIFSSRIRVISELQSYLYRRFRELRDESEWLEWHPHVVNFSLDEL